MRRISARVHRHTRSTKGRLRQWLCTNQPVHHMVNLLTCTRLCSAHATRPQAWRYGAGGAVPAATAAAATAAGATGSTGTATAIINPFTEEAIDSTLLPAKALALASFVLCVLAKCVNGGMPFGELVAAVALWVGGCGPSHFRDARMVYWHLGGVISSFMHTGVIWVAFTKLMLE